ncbi:glycosyltransferase family protein [Streptomyces akebiae]|uniref:hypothetical protein n=1 Tax=Streptomyces akebiae TaxID=2865673 RepID=UPI002175CA8C|nr:hypothetical protein [Streptomyces akebiae]
MDTPQPDQALFDISRFAGRGSQPGTHGPADDPVDRAAEPGEYPRGSQRHQSKPHPVVRTRQGASQLGNHDGASLDPSLLVPFVREVADGRADLVLGRRRPQGRGVWPAHARAGNLALARMLRRRTGLRLHDLGPLRAARRDSLLALGLTDRRSGYPLQMVVRAADAGWRVTEHDVPYLPRTGASKVTGTWRGTWQAVRDMSRVLNETSTPASAEGVRR